ncbi:glycoside hydrolase family 15 protein [Hephaestia mangrovi]|uniref:glycoside hydrolase family 15 protein n=1 Tax=Hephaestia mangrovi TaxID=2873268 RepID=UPI001CA763F7|nr:glycoside hydrolase family 15 protein [Hephaestia mangrovi]MBY8829814.1 glycoside hydrolase family 15 protein [Hephaestia mangrovi]
MSATGAKRIEDYALIGDGQTAALVSREGAIDWMCLPRFDSEACFAALLGDEDNGCWQIAPDDAVTSTRRRYLGDTLVLETEFTTESGVVAVTDFMPMRGEAPDIVRIVEGRSGRVKMRSALAIRFNYGQVHPLIRREDGLTMAIAGPNAVRLDFDVGIEFDDRWGMSRFEIGEGERVTFVMTWFESYRETPQPVDAETALADTCAWWEEWAAKACYEGEYRDQAMRSLITLKALIHQPTGAIVAAPTASLPERPGGARNWDYRFCWLRDSTFTLLALIGAELFDEADAWVHWLRRAVAGEPIDLRPFYSVGGDRRMIEWEADWLDGFGGAKPVRFGNGAAGQLQLDIYGEVLDTLFVAANHDVAPSDEADALFRLLVGDLERHWDKPDAGIWESRGDPKCHVYSKAMCWVAFDRAARWFEGNDADASEKYRALAEQVRAEVLDKGFDAEQNSFTGAYGDPALDAAVLRLPLTGFIEADDPRMIGTVAAIERELMKDGFVKRYQTEQTDDGVGGGEGAFLAASFWLVDVLALQGRAADAEKLFGRLCGLTNDVGLLAEEYGYGQQLGNFPQALSHLSLVVSALNLTMQHGPARERKAR